MLDENSVYDELAKVYATARSVISANPELLARSGNSKSEQDLIGLISKARRILYQPGAVNELFLKAHPSDELQDRFFSKYYFISELYDFIIDYGRKLRNIPA